MTDNKTIKALELAIHRYKDTTHHVSCIVDINILKKAINLINRQKAEIERLEEESADKERAYTAEYCLRKELKTEFKTAQSETIKEFAERLKETITNAINTYYNSNGGGYYLAEDVIEDIDDLVKEMTEVEE